MRWLLVLILTGFAWSQDAVKTADQWWNEVLAATRTLNWVRAEPLLKGMRAAYPEDPRWAKVLMTALSGQGKFGEALQLGLELAKTPQYREDALHALGNAAMLAQLGRLREAMEENQRALSIAKTPVEQRAAHEAIAELFLRDGRIESAVTEFRRAKERTGTPSPRLGFALDLSGDRVGAKAEYASIAALNSRNPLMFHTLANGIVESKGDLALALQYAREAVSLDAKTFLFQDTLGRVLFANGELLEAENTLMDALLMERGNVGIAKQSLAKVMDSRNVWDADRRSLRAMLARPNPTVEQLRPLVSRVRIL